MVTIGGISGLLIAMLRACFCVLGKRQRLNLVLIKTKRQQDAGVTVATHNIT